MFALLQSESINTETVCKYIRVERIESRVESIRIGMQIRNSLVQFHLEVLAEKCLESQAGNEVNDYRSVEKSSPIRRTTMYAGGCINWPENVGRLPLATGLQAGQEGTTPRHCAMPLSMPPIVSHAALPYPIACPHDQGVRLQSML